MKIKALSLFSGGLDSTLATKIILDLGIELKAVYFYTVFCPHSRDKEGCERVIRNIAEELDVTLEIKDVSEEFLEVVKSPKYGYGNNLNPCIDCRIFMLKKTKECMLENDAKFVVTGEVLGERPMSQNLRSLELIDREAALEGFVLRPLSAKLLEPTIPEKEGWVEREKLFSIQGRSRKKQFELLKKLNIKNYLEPAGGCLLTDPIFSQRVEELLEYNELDLDNINLLKLGRYFRISSGLKLVVGRNEEDNRKLINFAKPKDLLLQVIETPGPVALAKGEDTDKFINEISKKVASYADKVKGAVKIVLKRKEPFLEEVLTV
ncbi:MAG: hypothetical protein NC818_05935 [Candidatus Omnitrophica bacterium]|nr:hypothetical protein [Candidatus Omnitrophota bacterium]